MKKMQRFVAFRTFSRLKMYSRYRKFILSLYKYQPTFSIKKSLSSKFNNFTSVLRTMLTFSVLQLFPEYVIKKVKSDFFLLINDNFTTNHRRGIYKLSNQSELNSPKESYHKITKQKLLQFINLFKYKTNILICSQFQLGQ